MTIESGVTIKEAGTEDIRAIAALLSEMRDTDVAVTEITEQFVQRFMNSNERCILFAYDEDGTALGMLAINLIYKIPKSEAHIDEVIVAASARGKGVGTLIMNAAEAWAWDHDATEIGFTSRASRVAANKLYVKLGYELRETNVYRKKQPSEE